MFGNSAPRKHIAIILTTMTCATVLISIGQGRAPWQEPLQSIAIETEEPLERAVDNPGIVRFVLDDAGDAGAYAGEAEETVRAERTTPGGAPRPTQSPTPRQTPRPTPQATPQAMPQATAQAQSTAATQYAPTQSAIPAPTRSPAPSGTAKATEKPTEKPTTPTATNRVGGATNTAEGGAKPTEGSFRFQAQLCKRTLYTACGHSVETVETLPREWAGLSLDELSQKAAGWQVIGVEGSGKVLFVRVAKGYCEAHRLVQLDAEQDVISVYCHRDDVLEEVLRIPLQDETLPEEQRRSLEAGVWVDSMQAAEGLLEDIGS